MNGTLILATLEEAGRKFSRRPDTGGAGLVLLVVVLLVALVALGVYIVRRLIVLSSRPDAAGALFEDLADAHELSAADRRLLRKLARRENLPDPARLFIDRGYLELLAKSSSDPSYRALFDRLFGK